MTFRLGARSRRELAGVHPGLAAVVERALGMTTVDFAVHDGLRTATEQHELFRRGASQLDGYRKLSKHQAQADGFGHAVDLVPWLEGRLRWEWPLLYVVAGAVRQAARAESVGVRWGGCWRRLDTDARRPEEMVRAYVSSRVAAGRKAFSDGPHFELI